MQSGQQKSHGGMLSMEEMLAWIKQALEQFRYGGHRLLFSKNRASDQGKKRISVSGQ